MQKYTITVAGVKLLTVKELSDFPIIPLKASHLPLKTETRNTLFGQVAHFVFFSHLISRLGKSGKGKCQKRQGAHRVLQGPSL